MEQEHEQEREREFFTRLQQAVRAEQGECFVVGGFVRDALGSAGVEGAPGAVSTNIDLAVARGAVELTRRLAQRLGGTFVLLHEDFGSARVVLPDGYEIDVTDFRADTLDADLRARDFTVNAMAVPLERMAAPDWGDALVDPLGGRRDLTKRRLRLCHAKSLADDPVRIIRGVALAAQWDLEILPDTARAMRASAGLLADEAPERVMESFWKLLAVPRSADWFGHMDELGILNVIMPELGHGRDVTQGGYHHLDVLQHQLQALRELEELFEPSSDLLSDIPELTAHLAEPVSDKPRSSVMKLGVLCHDIGKPFSRTVDEDGRVWFKGHEVIGARMARDMGRRLRMARRQREAVTLYVRHHLRPGQLARLRREAPAVTEAEATPESPTPRAVYRFFRDANGEGIATLVIWLADRSATRGPDSDDASLPGDRVFVREMLEQAFHASDVVSPPRLLTGTQLMEGLGIAPGPLVGRLLEDIAEAQVEGTVGTAEEALAFAASQLSRGVPAPEEQTEEQICDG